MTFKQEYFALKLAESIEDHPNWTPEQNEMYNGHSFKYETPRSATDIERIIKEYCRMKGAVCTKVYSGGRPIVDDPAPGIIKAKVKFIPSTTRAGTSDLIIGKDEKILFAEVKYGADTQKPNQKLFQKEVERCRCDYEIFRTLDEFQTIFKQHYETI